MHILKIECIGLGSPRKRDFGVAEITGVATKEGGFVKRELSGQRDYSESNGAGTRGVYVYYLLDDGKIYEVRSPASWNRTDHYFVTHGQGQEWRMTIGEVFQALSNARLVSMSSQRLGNG